MRRLPPFATILAAALVLAAPAAQARPHPARVDAWAPADTATVHPGVQTLTAGAQCTANFIFSDGANVYIGQAAHCAGTGAATDTNGCTAASLPLGTKVKVGGASKPGTLVYSSWLTMQSLHERDANTCQYNDLAIVRLNARDVAKVNPSIPVWGGPTSVSVGGTDSGERIYSYGNSSLRGGVTTVSPKTGFTLGTDSGGWNDSVYTVSPGIPGDSGSAFLDSAGAALGILSTLQIAPLPGANGVGNLSSELDYMHANSSFGGVNLVPGTEPFNPDAVPVG